MRKKKIMQIDDKFRTILGRLTATAFYELQEMRISQTNMIRDIIRRKDLGIGFSEVEKKQEEKTYDKDYADKLLKDRIKAMFKQGKLTEAETTYIETVLENISKIGEQEKSYCKLLAEYVKDEPIYTEFLQHVRGVSFVLTANLLRYFGYCDGKKENGDELCPTISSLWKYCGLAPDQKRTKGEKANYNPKAKVLAWKIADSMLKQRTPIYRDIYDAEKIRQEEILSQVDGEKAVKMHSHLRAMRKMVKMFLAHYWLCARELKGLSVTKPYIIGKGNHSHFVGWKEVVEANKVKRKTKVVKAKKIAKKKK